VNGSFIGEEIAKSVDEIIERFEERIRSAMMDTIETRFTTQGQFQFALEKDDTDDLLPNPGRRVGIDRRRGSLSTGSRGVSPRGRYCCKRFCSSDRARLIQTAARKRKIDSNIRPFRFDCLPIPISQNPCGDFCNNIGPFKPSMSQRQLTNVGVRGVARRSDRDSSFARVGTKAQKIGAD